MKTKSLIIILLAITATFFSCDDYLVEEPFSFSSSEVLFTNEANAELALTGVYDILNASTIQAVSGMYQPLWGRGMHYLTNVGTDEAIGNTASISDAQLKQCVNYSYNSETQTVSHAWFALYAGINRCNAIIKYVPGINGVDEVRRTQIIAEARFFRGFYLTYLAWLFGAVPVPTEQTTDIYAARQPLSVVYDQVIKDITFAYENLPNRNKLIARIDKYTAGAMLSKVYLYLASCKENNVKADPHLELNSFDWVDMAAYYTKSEQISEDVYKNSLYILQPNYKYLFIADSPSAKPELQKESLLTMQSGTGGYREFFLAAFLTGVQGGTGTNGGGYGWLRGMGELADKYSDNDSRKTHNITGSMPTTPTTETLFGVKYFLPGPVNSSGSNYCLGKYRQSDPLVRTGMGVAAASGINDYSIIRFADVILMYAEAAYKNGNETLARKLLEDIRLRAAAGNALDAYDLKVYYMKTDFMQELMDERSRELCGECWRRFDLMRWGKLESVIANTQITNAKGNMYYWNNLYAKNVKDNFRSYKMWYPIPKREMEVNPNLVPNPGY
jgi:hypothetical protein